MEKRRERIFREQLSPRSKLPLSHRSPQRLTMTAPLAQGSRIRNAAPCQGEVAFRPKGEKTEGSKGEKTEGPFAPAARVTEGSNGEKTEGYPAQEPVTAFRIAPQSSFATAAHDDSSPCAGEPDVTCRRPFYLLPPAFWAAGRAALSGLTTQSYDQAVRTQ